MLDDFTPAAVSTLEYLIELTNVTRAESVTKFVRVVIGDVNEKDLIRSKKTEGFSRLIRATFRSEGATKEVDSSVALSEIPLPMLAELMTRVSLNSKKKLPPRSVDDSPLTAVKLVNEALTVLSAW